jgi:hypothetical protein
MPLADGVALWERYNRSGLAGLVGVDTFVTRYEPLVADPVGTLGTIAAWLGDLPQFAADAAHWDLPGAAASISPELRRQHPSGERELLLDEHRHLLDHLDSLDGPHRPLKTSPPGVESAWTTAVLDDRRQKAVLARQCDALRRTLSEHEAAAEALAIEVAEQMEVARGESDALRQQAEGLRAQLEVARSELAGMYALYEHMEASTSWRVTRPLRQVASLRSRKGAAPGN